MRSALTPAEWQQLRRIYKKLQRAIHRMATEKGFWSNAENRNIPSKLALMHSEISEALEAYRDGKMQRWYTDKGKPEGWVQRTPTWLSDKRMYLKEQVST
ncbi:MAG: hypothetical protein ACRD2L_10825 [Terriglobia bacterium]